MTPAYAARASSAIFRWWGHGAMGRKLTAAQPFSGPRRPGESGPLETPGGPGPLLEVPSMPRAVRPAAASLLAVVVAAAVARPLGAQDLGRRVAAAAASGGGTARL